MFASYFANLQTVDLYFRSEAMSTDQSDCGESRGDIVDADGDVFSGLRNMAGLTGALLLVGLGANGYLLRLTGRSRFPVPCETARLTLRYSSVVDLSRCLVLASLLLAPWVLFLTGSDITLTVRHTRVGVAQVSFLWSVLVGSGLVVVCRQVYMFHQETPRLHQHRWRTTKLLRDVIIVGAACTVASLFVALLTPDFYLPLCFAVGAMTPCTLYLFIVSVAVNVILGIVVVARATRPEVGTEPYHVTQNTAGDLSEKAMLSPESCGCEDGLNETTQSRWNRCVIFASVSVITWFPLIVALTLVGSVLQPTSVGAVVMMVSASALDSAWSSFAVFRHWT